jgi:hypothetical protein
MGTYFFYRIEMVNIILKAFDGPLHKKIVTEAFLNRKIGKCISITNGEEYTPDIDAQDIQWMSAKDLRAGRYPEIDWTKYKPLDEKLIEKMRHCEIGFLSMIERYALHGEIPYRERRQQYLDHLRYWNHTLENEDINLLLLFHAPHQCYDYVIYMLCKLKGIPTYFLEHYLVVDGISLLQDFEISGEQLLPAFKKLQQEYSDPSLPIPLSQSYEDFYKVQTTKDIAAQSTPLREKHLTKKHFLTKWYRKGLSTLRHKPKQFFSSLCSANVWSRKLKEHRMTQFYDDHVEKPDFSSPYIYAPLHMQPEESVSPRGGAFQNQELIMQMLAAHIPPGVNIYIKEHPAQGELCRSEEFYRTLLQIPSVKFMPRNTDTFQLMRNAKAVATVTGTVGIEAIFREKPVLMFGHRFYQYAPGIYRIHTNDDCRNAVQSIFQDEETPSLHDLRLFLKAMQDASTPYIMKPATDKQRDLQNTYLIDTGKIIHKTLTPLFTEL